MGTRQRARPGLVAVLGSGETAANGQRAFERVFATLRRPVRVAILETPAGFQPNSDAVAGEVGEFLTHRLQNHAPVVSIVPARRRDVVGGTDDPATCAPLLAADVFYLGAGGPTYAARHLMGSWAWHALVARHRLGAAVVLASAATLSAGAWVVPVYEIYKVGDDLHWQPGLDLFGPYGLRLAFVPHWNNTDGGADLDTSRCYLGRARFGALLSLLPANVTVVGLDEHTTLILDPARAAAEVLGRGGVTILRDDAETRVTTGEGFPLSALGPFHPADPTLDVPADILAAAARGDAEAPGDAAIPEPTAEVLALLGRRQAARGRRDWAVADAIRDELATLGWEVRDTSGEPVLVPIQSR